MAQPQPPPPPPPPPQPIVVVHPTAQPGAAQPLTNNGSTVYFQGLTQDSAVLPQNYDFVRAFQRSIKVFRMSYPEITMDNSPPKHTQKYQEYLDEMATLYNQNQPDMSFLNQMNADISSEYYQIVISCKRVVGRDNLTNPKFVVTYQTFQAKRDIDLTREVQPYAPLSVSARFNIFTMLRSNTNRGLILRIEENLRPGQQPQHPPLEHFNLIIANTHPEGFEDWIDFGRGVRLLINVFYKVTDEANITSEMVSTFHLRTIEMLLRKRMNAFTKMGGNLRSFHRMAAIKKSVCYRRQYIDRQTDSYFWSRPNIGTPFMASQLNLTQKVGTTTVRFIDMQIGFETNEDFEERVCLCSEWCNWNAFFYHNPIYRFLLVRHHQLFMKNMSNIPDIYLCVSVLLGCEPTPTIQKPILQLMYCANEYRELFYDRFYLKSPNKNQFQQLYGNSHPSALMMYGLNYNKLRHEFNITQLCHLLNPNPFADICIENLINYYNLLISLHKHLSFLPAFVSDKKLWSKDMDHLGRNKYSDYFKQSYDKCIAQFIVGHDFLFTDDYEYSTQLPKTEAHREIRDHRNRVKVSPFNVSVNTSVFLNTFASVYKFLSRVEPYLPGAYRGEAIEQVMICYKQMDIDFDSLRNANINLDFQFDSIRSGFNNLQQYFDLFYTLKLYFYAFEIQKHSINSVLKYNTKRNFKIDQVSSTFNFIWNYEFIERNYRNTYNGEVLFQIENFETVFTDFYDQYWGRAQHESQQIPRLDDCVLSTVLEYRRLYFWEQNNGYNRQKFARIMDSMLICLTNIIKKSKLIYNHIWFAVSFLANTPGYPIAPDIANRQPSPLGAELLDHLVYYLVKANCSVILSTVAKFLKPMHALQLDHLVRYFLSFSMCKPGWIHLFTTMTDVFTSLDDLKTRRIAFDDEFNRISNTCLQTKTMIKDIYRQFYTKLTHEWINELGTFFGRVVQPTPNMVPVTVEFMKLHVAYGLSFCAFFADTFRHEFSIYRKFILKKLNITAQPQLPNQTAFVQCLPVVREYLSNRQLIALARPLAGPPWQQHMIQFLAYYQQMTGQQLNIDLNLADI